MAAKKKTETPEAEVKKKLEAAKKSKAKKPATVGGVFRKVRVEAKLGLSEVANHLRTTAVHVGEVERGVTPMPRDWMDRLYDLIKAHKQSLLPVVTHGHLNFHLKYGGSEYQLDVDYSHAFASWSVMWRMGTYGKWTEPEYYGTWQAAHYHGICAITDRIG